MAAKIITFDHILACRAHRDLIFVSIPMFSWSKNPITPFTKTLNSWKGVSHLEFQNGRQEIEIISINLTFKHRWRAILLVVI